MEFCGVWWSLEQGLGPCRASWGFDMESCVFLMAASKPKVRAIDSSVTQSLKALRLDLPKTNIPDLPISQMRNIR